MTTDQPISQPQAPPVCPRHPDRVAYVRCQRCGRPACPECQRPAAVGIQCVDCVRDAAKSAPRTTTAVGGRVRRGRPTVTFTLIGICAVMFALQLTVPGWTGRFMYAPVLGVHEPWRFLTAAFLHSTGFFGHIIFNMWALYVTGQFLEPVLGRARFTALCVLSALGGSVAVLLLASPAQAVVGASGMVFGLFGAMVPVLRRLGGSAAQIIGLIAINGVIGFLVPGISWQGHLGGLVVGLALGYGFAHAPRERQKLFGWLLPAAVALVLVVAVVAKYAAVGVL
ncbi:rhomboid family intramembrane serine protease [Xylanibacterium ulmi]|uniref:rhomboid family intramembrane serine protease n=1 Tax=Xylanimonas ulmi TaxID=228973 RepID=UPI00102B6777|nr:rhomboid family intramembrane serine protease [Xylanibacterium ulmi]